jgi:chromosome partitioning protein
MIVTIANQKGGVGKTTLTFNLAHGLARRGHSVLVVDLDSQNDISTLFGVEYLQMTNSSFKKIDLSKPKTFKNIVINDEIISAASVLYGESEISEAILECDENLNLLPGSIRLVEADRYLPTVRTEDTLKNCLSSIEQDYDYILIDSPPGLGLISINALVAAQFLLVPTQHETLSTTGMLMILRTHFSVLQANPDLEVGGIVSMMTRPRQRLDRMASKDLDSIKGDRHFQSELRMGVDVHKANRKHQSLFQYNPKGNLALDMERIVNEFIERVK